MAAIKLLADRMHSIQRFDIVGVSDKPDYISHLALLVSPTKIRRGDRVLVAEMGPPLRAGLLDSRGPNHLHGVAMGHAIAWLDDLASEERDAIEAWIADVRTRVPADWRSCYTLDPPCVEFTDKVTNRSGMKKFSCAGFVLCAYEEGLGVKLLNCEPEDLPEVHWETIEQIYEDGLLEFFKVMGKRLGITGDGPWRLVLCGYVFHAVRRPAQDVRATPYTVSDVSEAQFSNILP